MVFHIALSTPGIFLVASWAEEGKEFNTTLQTSWISTVRLASPPLRHIAFCRRLTGLLCIVTVANVGLNRSRLWEGLSGGSIEQTVSAFCVNYPHGAVLLHLAKERFYWVGFSCIPFNTTNVLPAAVTHVKTHAKTWLKRNMLSTHRYVYNLDELIMQSCR